MVSRKWLATVVSAEETSTQVEVAFTRAPVDDGKEYLLDAALLDELAHAVVADNDERVPVLLALSDNGRHCMLLTQWREHVDDFASALRDRGHDPVILRGGMGTKARAAALDRLNPEPGGPPLLVIATVQYVGEGFDCPALDTLFLAAPIASKGRLVQCVGRILRPTPARPPPRSTTTTTSSPNVLASSLSKRAPGYRSLGFPDPRRGDRRQR